jgi:tetratricopeptide (TPR) repeat protein
MNSSVARIFLSSTFRDFGEERELLAKRVFPALRKRLQERFVELVDVDLRWGITPEAAERGEVLPICLAEIDRSRPWFIGMLGERYGWVPPSDKYDPALIEQRPWLAEHQGGKSVTELEILHGVLNDPKMAGRAFFYFRAPAYARRKGGDYVSTSSEDAVRLADLKDRIRASGFPVVEDYQNPDALAKRLAADLWAVLDEAHPLTDVPDAFTREQRRHEAYALPRRRLYLGGEVYQTTLDEAFTTGEQRIIIGGQSGGGKSALIANWLGRRRQTYTAEQIHEYYLGASADAASPVSLVRHLIERIKRTTGSQDEIPADPQALFDSMPTWLADASAHAGREGYRWIVTLDGLNNLKDLRDLRWLPEFLPERVHLLVSCLPGEVHDSLAARGTWQEVDVQPLTLAEQRKLLQTYLGHYNKTLEAAYEARVLAHPHAANPLFLRTLAEELRLFGRHEDLSDELDRYLSSLTVDDLFERVLERVEQDCGTRRVKVVLTAIWASRAGLAEEELLAFAGLVPATWAPIRLALDEALLESGGRLTFAHDYMRLAVSDRYLAGNNELGEENQSSQALALRRKAHEKLARWFTAHALVEQTLGDGVTAEDFTIDAARAAEEIPYQWRAARRWRQLKKCLTNRTMLEAFLEHRSGEELLGLWLDIEAATKTTLERAYQTAWKEWKPDTTAEETGDLAEMIAKFLCNAGRYRHPLARQLAGLGLAIVEKAQGPEHPDTGTRLSNLASLLRCMGDYAGAEPLFRRALAIAEKTLGAEHPITGKHLNNLGLLMHDKGQYSAAETIFRHALLISENSERLYNLADTLRQKGDYVAAEPLFRKSLEIVEKCEGADHPKTGTALRGLGNLLKDRGHYAAAEPVLYRALEIAEKSQGPAHPSTCLCISALAILFWAKGDHASAEPFLRRAFLIAEKSQGPEHPNTCGCLNNLARLLHHKGDHERAETTFQRAILIAEKAWGPDHPSTGTVIMNLGELLRDQRKISAAEPHLYRAFMIMEQSLGTAHPSTGKALTQLALLLQLKGDYAGAEGRLRHAIAIFCNNEGDHSISLATTYHHLGVQLRNAGRLDEAAVELQNALTIREAKDPNGKGLAHTLGALGKVQALRGDKAKALAFYSRSLEVLQAQDDPDEADITQLMERIAELDAD